MVYLKLEALLLEQILLSLWCTKTTQLNQNAISHLFWLQNRQRMSRKTVLIQNPRKKLRRSSICLQKLIWVPITTITTIIHIHIQWTFTTVKIIITTILTTILPNKCAFTRVLDISCLKPINAVTRIRDSLRRKLASYLIILLLIHYKNPKKCFTVALSPNPSKDTQRWSGKDNKLSINTPQNWL